MSKKTVAILMGGRSGEHEVSLQSAKSVINAINKNKYDIVRIGIDKSGRWLWLNDDNYLLNSDDPAKISLKTNYPEIYINPTPNKNNFICDDKNIHVDIVFPVLHGTYGEDGTLQGMLDMMGLPYVGAGTAGSSVAMDKDIAKRLFVQAGIPTSDFVSFNKTEWKKDKVTIKNLITKLGLPIFVKPANLGSSVGINKAKNETELQNYIDEAFLFDTKVICEESINAREIECSILGNDEPQASICGEIIPQHEFYSYEAKYLDPDGALLKIPAEIPQDVMDRCRELGCQAFKILNCRGMARVDFFLDKDTNKIYINELNTIPGFTKISMYPKLWAKSGIEYPQLIDKLIDLALEHHRNKSELKTDFK